MATARGVVAVIFIFFILASLAGNDLTQSALRLRLPVEIGCCRLIVVTRVRIIVREID
jgi:hypothetical protein